MKTSGRFRAGSVVALLALTGLGPVAGMSDQPPAPTGPVEVPAEAVYLGTPDGGDFVLLQRRDVQIDGQILPAFEMQLFGAVSSGGAYGAERLGYPDFHGLGLYVPPDILLGQAHVPYDPPGLDYIFAEAEGEPNAWVDGGAIHVRLRPISEDPQGLYVASIMPVRLPPAP